MTQTQKETRPSLAHTVQCNKRLQEPLRRTRCEHGKGGPRLDDRSGREASGPGGPRASRLNTHCTGGRCRCESRRRRRLGGPAAGAGAATAASNSSGRGRGSQSRSRVRASTTGRTCASTGGLELELETWSRAGRGDGRARQGSFARRQGWDSIERRRRYPGLLQTAAMCVSGSQCDAETLLAMRDGKQWEGTAGDAESCVARCGCRAG